MKTYALYGESGTGKSYNAMSVASKYNADFIIDDGLLISSNKVVAGQSAKKESCMMAAVKRAIFESEEARLEMQNSIKEHNPNAILILGTSKKMVDKIRTRLNLPEFSEYVYIGDVVSSDDMAKAKLIRQSQGKHIIPVPAMEIRKTFSGYFLDALRVFTKGINSETCEDKSIVRPTYSYLGDFVINDTVLCSLATYETSKCQGVDRVIRTSVEKNECDVIFHIDVVLCYGTDIKKCCNQIIEAVKTSVEEYASVYIDYVNVSVKSLSTRELNPAWF